MVKKLNITIFIGVATLSLMQFGCVNNSPFVPVAVPQISSTRPNASVDESEIDRELELLQTPKMEQYVISTNDTFAIVVAGYDSFSRPKTMVMPDGTISVAPIGSIKISGLSIPEASKLLSAKFSEYIIDANVTLEPLTLKQFTFTIDGMVKNPGIYSIDNGSTRLLDAFAMAKGFVSGTFKEEPVILSDLNNAYIARDGKILPVDFTKALAGTDPRHNIPIIQGDYIYIPTVEAKKITILGEVEDPTAFIYQPNLTVAQAIGYAGGLKSSNNDVIKVIRGGLKNPEVFNLNVKDILNGRMMDFALQPQDIVYVPRDGLSEWNVIMSELLPTFQLINAMAGPFGNPITELY